MIQSSGNPLSGISRRQFVGGAAASVVGFSLAACTDNSQAGRSAHKASTRLIPPEQLFDPLLPPTQFRVSLSDTRAIQTSWVGGCVASGQPRYRIYLDGAVAATTGTLSAVLRDVTPGPHAVAVATVDSVGDESIRTPESVVAVPNANSTTAADLLPLVLEAVPAASAIQFRWSLDQGYSGPSPDSYRLIRSDLSRPIAITNQVSGAVDTWYFATGVTPDVVNEYHVEAVDSTGKAFGRSINSVRAMSYQRDWPSGYPSPAAPAALAMTLRASGSTVSWRSPTESVDTNVFADGKFVAQVPASESRFQTSATTGRRQVSIRSVSRWGVSSDEAKGGSAPVAPPRRSIFSTREGLIFDPSGAPFVPVGANVSGMDFFWNEKIFSTASAARDGWRMTAIRVDCGIRDWGAVSGAQGHIFFSNNNLDRIVKEYTGAGLVVIIGQFNKGLTSLSPTADTGLLSTVGGSAPDGTGRSVEDATVDWWIEVARRYRSNPRVWLNPINEPQNDIDGLQAQYSRMLARIRAVAPLTPLVLDAANFANDIPNDATIGDGPIREVDSFVLQHGRDLFEKFGEPMGYGPIIFSIHAYSRWPRNYKTNEIITDAKLADRMRSYVRDVRSRGLPLLVGETGVEDIAPEYDSASVRVGLYEQGSVGGQTTGVWEEQQVGVLAWHASPVSGMPLASKPWSSVSNVGETAAPPDAGRGIWNYCHRLRP